MKDESIPTAVVYSNALDLLTHTDTSAMRTLTIRMTAWQRLSGANRNICLFLFPRMAMATLDDVLRQRGGAWQFLRPLLFTQSGTPSSQTFFVGPPRPEEVVWLIERQRLVGRASADVARIDELAVALCRLPAEISGQLKQFHARLSGKRSIRPEDIMSEFGVRQQDTAMDRLRSMVGLEAVRSRIEQILRKQEEEDEDRREEAVAPPSFPTRLLPAVPSHSNATLHVLIKGRPGTGKTTVAKLLGDIYRDHGLLPAGHTVVVTRKDLVAGYVGQTALRTAEKIEEAMGGVLFVDEAYQLSEGTENDFGKEAIETIMEAMSARNGRFAVVLAGYPEKMDAFLRVNEGLTRKFGGNIIEVDDYKPPVLRQIFVDLAQRDGRDLHPELAESLTVFFENWYRARDPKTFGNGGDVVELYQRLEQRRADRMRGQRRAPKQLTADDLPDDLRRHLVPQPTDAEEVLRALDDIVGLDAVKNEIREMFNLARVKRLRHPGHRASPGHFQFVGPPGTGKTTVAKRMGDMLRVLGLLERGHVVKVSRADLVANHQGGSAPKTTEKVLEAIDGVLFIDEAYQLVQDDRDTFGKEASGALLDLMEEHRERLCVIIAGYPKDIARFVSSNEGYATRFGNKITFASYRPDEMLAILDRMMDQGIRMTDGFRAGSLQVFEAWERTPDSRFVNGRGVRNYLDIAMKRQATRLQGVAGGEDIWLLTEDDVPRELAT